MLGLANLHLPRCLALIRRTVSKGPLQLFLMFDAFKRLFSSDKAASKQNADSKSKRHIIDTCPDCEVQSGELHDLFCTKERCPFCGGQLMSCDCIRSVLKLSEEESRALDEYVDDSVPPLSQIMQRWREALDTKGRVPFESYPDDPIRAAYRGDIEAVKAFLDDGFPPNAGNEVGYTMLMGAARSSNLAAVRFMLSHGAQAALADKRGYTALHWAVAQPTSNPSNELNCVRVLIDAGADVNARNEEGITPLMNAAWFGCRDSVRELLRRGADASLRDSKGRSALDLAVERNHKDIEKLLK